MIARGTTSLRVLPASRSECRRGPRPCPYVSCRYHLLLNVASDGRLWSQVAFDEADAESIAVAVEALGETCALDVADDGEHTFEEVGVLMGRDAKRVFEDTQRAQAKVANAVGAAGAEMSKNMAPKQASATVLPSRPAGAELERKCRCPAPKHLIAQTAWSAFSGYELRWLCKACGATWDTRQHKRNAPGRMF